MRFVLNASNTFCISLDSRWPRMSARLGALGIECERWIASTPDQVVDRFAGYLNGGQRACGQSHVNVWRMIVERGLEYALILEDDAMFANDWREKLDLLSGVDDPEWDAVFLNASEPIIPEDTWVVAREQYLTGAYIISQRGAQCLLEWYANEFASSDWMTSRLQTRGHSYSYFPWLVIQEGLDSTIGSGVEADHAKVVRCLGEERMKNYCL
jgi:GR25 family glycosyltransferase involved in LPS biosynthesis